MFLTYFSKNKTIIVLIILLIVCIVLINWRPKSAQENLAILGETILSPFVWIADTVSNLISPVFTEASTLETANKRIKKLEKQVLELKENLILFDTYKNQVGEFKKKYELDFERLLNPISDLEFIPAQVVMKSPIHDFQIIIIEKGLLDDIETNMPVVAITEDESGKPRTGVVGKIGIAGLFYSVVIPITSPFSNVSAKVYGKRYTGILQGLGRRTDSTDYQSILNFLDRDANIEDGDEIVTSGIIDPNSNLSFSFFPPYLVLGTIEKVPERDVSEFSKKAYVKPFTNFSTLENLYIIRTHGKKDLFTTKDFVGNLLQWLLMYKNGESPLDFWNKAKDL